MSIHIPTMESPKSNSLQLYTGSNRFKGLELIDIAPEEWWTEVCDRTGDSDQNYPQEKEMEKGKMVPEEALQIAEKRMEAKSKGEKETYT